MKSLNFASHPVRRMLQPGTFRTGLTVLAAGMALAFAGDKTDTSASATQTPASAIVLESSQQAPADTSDALRVPDTAKAPVRPLAEKRKTRSLRGYAALTRAIKKADTAGVERLIQSGVDLEPVPTASNGVSTFPPLCDAMGWWNQYKTPARARVITLLIEGGANPDDTVAGWVHWARQGWGLSVQGFAGNTGAFPVADFPTCTKCLKRVARQPAETRMQKAVAALCSLRLSNDASPLKLGARVQAEQGLTDPELNRALLNLFYIEQGKVPKDTADK